MPKQKKTTIADIARTTGVSTATVSRVLNQAPIVKQATREKVQEALRDADYELRPNNTRSLMSHTIAVLVPDIANPWFPLLIKGIENAARIHGYRIILCDSENRQQIELHNFRMALESGVDGLIVVPTSEESDLLNEMPSEDYPVVYLDRIPNSANAHWVTSDNKNGAYQATKYLLSLGHQRIVYVAGPPKSSPEPQRFAGYKAALEESGVAVTNELIIQGDYGWELARDSIQVLLSSKVEFTAVFSSNDVMAFGIKQTLEARGYRIPDDISIVGFDDTPFAELVGLTSVHQPTSEMGRSAFFLLVNRIEGKILDPQQINLRTSLIIRDSCKRL